MKSPKSTPSDRVTIRMPEKLRTALEGLAERDHRKISDYMRNVLRQHVQNTSKATK